MYSPSMGMSVVEEVCDAERVALEERFERLQTRLLRARTRRRSDE